jgi:hypothetical protein
MAFYLSPLVDVNEIDLTTTIPAVATSIAVTVLRNTYKGPENEKTFITSTNELVDKFGYPTDDASCYQDILSATGYLEYGNSLYCTRTMPTSATFAGTKAVTGSGSFTPYTSGGAFILTDFPSEDPDNFHEEVIVTGNPMWFIASSRGEWGNNIRLAIVNKKYQSEILSGGNSTWETYGTIASVDSPLETNKDFLVIVEAREQKESTWSVVETFNVSTDTNALDDQGIKKHAETVINQQSNYIRIALSPDQKDSDVYVTTENYQQFGGGVDNQGDSLQDGTIMNALDLYANPEEIDVNMLIDSNKSETIKRYMIQICESRMDCMAVLDCPYNMVVYNRGNETTDLRNWRRSTFNENTSYAAVYGNWLDKYDRWNQKYRWIPMSGHAAGIFANTDGVSDPWFAPAGLNRAIMNNIRRLAWNPTLAQRDILYKNGINPVVSFAGQGKVIWGQKTYLDKSSAFNRINVRRLFMVLEKAISTACKYFLFEPNDPSTRIQLIDMITPFLRDVQGRRGIYEFAVVCNETNNTPERIDRNELWCDIYIKPTRAAEFIVLNFIATKTGANFSEIAAL